MLNGEIDAVITSLVKDHPFIEYRKLFKDEQLALAAKGHPWESKSYIEPKDFADQNVIIYNKPIESVSLFIQLLLPKGIMPKKVTDLQLTEAQIEMVKAGYGVKVIAKVGCRTLSGITAYYCQTCHKKWIVPYVVFSLLETP